MIYSALIPSAFIGAIASARSMTPMATIATARLAGRHMPGRLFLLDHPLFKFGALAMGASEVLGDKMKSALDRTAFLGLPTPVMSAGIAEAALAPRARKKPTPPSRWAPPSVVGVANRTTVTC